MLAKKFSILYKTAITLGLLVAMCLLSSCAEPQTTDNQDYIGPSDSQSAIQPPLENKKTQEPNSSPIVKIEQNGPIDITINEAVLISLQKNKSLAVEKLSPQIKRTFEQQALAVFDPDLKGTVSGGQTRLESPPAPGAGPLKSIEKTFGADASLNEFLPTGTTLSLDGSVNRLDESYADPFVSSRLGGSVTQSLLRGFGTAVNLVSVNQARIDTKISQYELRGFVESLVAQIEEAYWN